MTTRRTAVLLLSASLVFAAIPPAAADGEITVFAAASMKTALDAIGASYAKETGRKVVFSYAASGALAKQIAEGAPADIFVSADQKWMDHVAKLDAIDTATRRVIAGNALVLIAPADSAATITLTQGADIAGLLGDGRLAIGEPRSVPAGAYAVEALKKLGMYSAVEARFAPAESVRAALALVATGEAPLGIVYATDAKAEPEVKVVATFTADTHAPIVYPAAVTKAASDPAAAAAFLDYVTTEPGQELLRAQGFSPAP